MNHFTWLLIPASTTCFQMDRSSYHAHATYTNPNTRMQRMHLHLDIQPRLSHTYPFSTDTHRFARCSHT